MVEKVADDEVVIVEEVGSGETAVIDELVPEQEVEELMQAVEAIRAAGIVVGDATKTDQEKEARKKTAKTQEDEAATPEAQKPKESAAKKLSKKEGKTQDKAESKLAKRSAESKSKLPDKKEAADAKDSSAEGVAAAEVPFMEIPKGITGITSDVEALEAQLAESKQLGRVIGISFIVLASIALVGLLLKRWLRARSERERLKESRYYTNFMNYTLDMDDKDLDDRVDYVAMEDNRPMWLS